LISRSDNFPSREFRELLSRRAFVIVERAKKKARQVSKPMIAAPKFIYKSFEIQVSAAKPANIWTRRHGSRSRPSDRNIPNYSRAAPFQVVLLVVDDTPGIARIRAIAQ
jgi:hypothetical protein